jgi:hypothetical protein
MGSTDDRGAADRPATPTPRLHLGAPWVDPTLAEQFLREALQDPSITVEITEGGSWSVNGGRRTGDLSRSILGTETVCAEEIAQALLNRSLIAPRAQETLRKAAGELEQRFEAWVLKSPERVEFARRRYNELFSAEVPLYPQVEIRHTALHPEASFEVDPDRFERNRMSILTRNAPILMEHRVGRGKEPPEGPIVPGALSEVAARLRAARSAAPAFPTSLAARLKQAFRDAPAPPPGSGLSNDRHVER